MNTLKHIIVHCDGPLMRVTINRPEVLNALNPLAHYELAEAFDAFANDDRLHVATISGTGDRAFCVGTDLKARAESGRDEHPQTGFAGLTECYDLNEPVVALVNGDAIGGVFKLFLPVILPLRCRRQDSDCRNPKSASRQAVGCIDRLNGSRI